MDIVGVIRSILIRVLVVGTVIVVAGVLVNWGFLLVYGKTLWTLDWPGGIDTLLAFGAIMLLLLVFPFLYLFTLKTGLVLSVLGTIWGSYRDTITNEIIDEVAPKVVGVAQKGSAYKYDIQTAVSSWRDKLPLAGRLAINQLLKRVPMLEQLVETIEGLEVDALQDEESFKTSVKSSMQPYLEKTSISTTGGWSGLIKLVVINAVVLGCLLALILL